MPISSMGDSSPEDPRMRSGGSNMPTGTLFSLKGRDINRPLARGADRPRQIGALPSHLNLKALAERFMEVLSDDERWCSLQQGAIMWGTQFSWDRVAQQLIEVTDEVEIERRAGRPI